MPRYTRSFVAGGTYFFTVALANRQSGLLVEEIGRLRHAYARVQQLHPFETLAICVLPDHLHALWRLAENDGDAPLRWGLIKAGFSQGLVAARRNASQVSRREKGIWQRRYWEHQIRNDEDLRRHIDYIHFNPVKHGWSREVRDWPFSSFHRWVARRSASGLGTGAGRKRCRIWRASGRARRGQCVGCAAKLRTIIGHTRQRTGEGAQAQLAHPTTCHYASNSTVTGA
jgi:putative transposase